MKGGRGITKLGLVAGLILSLATQAQETEDSATGGDGVHVLETMVVTASRKVRALDSPNSISIITAEELEEFSVKTVAEALGRIPGVSDRSSNQDAISIRGAESAMAGSPLILIDGVPHKAGPHEYDSLSFIPVSQIERIEVIKSGGLAAGVGAGRGVINIITKRGTGEEELQGSLRLSYGSWNTSSEELSIWGTHGQFDYLVGVSDLRTEGYEDEDSETPAGMLKLGLQATETTHLGWMTNYVGHEQQNAYDLNKRKWHTDSGYGNNLHFPVSATDPRLYWHQETQNSYLKNALTLDYEDDAFSLKGSLSRIDFDEEYHALKDLLIAPTKIYTTCEDQVTHDARLNGETTIALGNGTLYTPSFGVVYTNKAFEGTREYPNDPGKDVSAYDMDINQTIMGALWENDIVFDTFELNIGGRVDNVEIDYEDAGGGAVKQDKTLFGWLVAPSCRLGEKSRVYLLASRTHWGPTPQYYAWAASGGGGLNRPEDLKPEVNTTCELGYKTHHSRQLRMAAAVYYTVTTEKYLSVYEGNSWRGVKNVGDAETLGFELEADGRLKEWFGYRISAAYLDAEWTGGTEGLLKGGGSVDGKKIDGIPQWGGGCSGSTSTPSRDSRSALISSMMASTTSTRTMLSSIRPRPRWTCALATNETTGKSGRKPRTCSTRRSTVSDGLLPATTTTPETGATWKSGWA